MPIYLKIAEKIYKEFLSKKMFTDKPSDYLNLLIKQVRKEIKGTKIRLLHNFIDFHEGFHIPGCKDRANMDISLMPSYKEKDEFLLWLAIFIEKITIGGSEHLPPLVEDIPPHFTISSNPEELLKLECIKKITEQVKTKESQFLAEFEDYLSTLESKESNG